MRKHWGLGNMTVGVRFDDAVLWQQRPLCGLRSSREELSPGGATAGAREFDFSPRSLSLLCTAQPGTSSPRHMHAHNPSLLRHR